MSDEVRQAICEIVVRGERFCSPTCRWMKSGWCWRSFTQQASPSEIKTDAKGRLVRTVACVAAEKLVATKPPKKGGTR